MRVVQIVARQIAEIVDLEIAPEMHAEPLLPPAIVHIVVGQERGAAVACMHAVLRDVAFDEVGPDGQIGIRLPVMIDAEHGRVAIEKRTIDVREQHADILLVELLGQARGAEETPGLAAFVRREHTIARAAEAAVEFDRSIDLARTVAVVRRATDTSRIDELTVVVEQTEIEDALILGEERTLVAEVSFGRAEVDDEIVALDLAEVRLERCGKLKLPARLPENVRAFGEVTMTAHVVVQARHVWGDREQGLAESRHFDAREIRQKARLVETRGGPRNAFASRTDDAVEIDAERALAVARLAHRRGVPRNQYFDRPAFRVFADRGLPDAVPILVEVALVGDDAVVDCAGGRDGEVVAGAAVADEVDDQIDAVDLIGEVALHALARARHVRGLHAAECDREALRRRH